MAKSHKKVVILGGGVTGLSAAFKILESSDFEVIVIEKTDRVGGLSGTFKYGPFLLDYGPHKIYTQLKDVENSIIGILDNKLLSNRKRSGIYFSEKLLKYPIDIKELLFRLDFLSILRCVFWYIQSFLKRGFLRKEIKSYEDWVMARLGKGLYELIFRDLARKVWGEPEKISYKIAERRISTPDIGTLLLRFLGKGFTVIDAKNFYYPEGGMGVLTESLQEKIRLKGGIIKFESLPERINLNRDRIDNIIIRHKDTGEKVRLEVDFLISSIPVTELFLLFDTLPKHEIFESLGRLKFRNLILIYITLRKENILDKHWVFFPEKEFIFSRLSEQKLFCKSMVPEGKTVLCADLACEGSSQIWNLSDREISGLAISQLHKAGFFEIPYVEDSFIKRFEAIYPIYHVGYEESLKKLLSKEDSIENLISIGRLGLFNYCNIDHCIDMGFSAADYLLSGCDKSKWIEGRKKFEYYKIID